MQPPGPHRARPQLRTTALNRLQVAANRRELSAPTAAAVLDWRIEHAHPQQLGPLRWLPHPHPATQRPEWATYLARRAELVAELADHIRDTTRTWTPAAAPVWAKAIIAADPDLTAEIAVFRAAHSVEEADTRLLGPRQFAVRARNIQQARTRTPCTPSAPPHPSHPIRAAHRRHQPPHPR